MRELDLCRHLIREAEDLRFDDPREAVRLAKQARDRAAAIDRQAIGMPQWLRLQADVWAVLGSALRSVSDLREAEGALNVALCFLSAPEARADLDPLTHARLAQRAAYLRCDQRRFEESLELINEALGIYEEQGDAQAAAGALSDRGLILKRCGRREEALADLRTALERLDPRWSLRYVLAAVHNMAFCLYELATTPQDNRRLFEWLELACRCHAALPERVNLLKLRSLYGLTAIRLGRFEEGVAELWRSQEGFKGLGAVYDQSLILLHLAAAYLSRGRGNDVKRVAGQLFPVFRSLEIDREALTALMLFYSAAQADTATQDLIDQVAATLQRAQSRGLRMREA